MDSMTSDIIRQKYGIYTVEQPHDDKFIYVKSSLTSDECLAIFNEMTLEIFDKVPHLLKNTTLMVHLFPPKSISTKLNHLLDVKPENHSEFFKLDEIKLETGVLKKCRLNFLEYDSTHEWYYFLHNNWKYYGSLIKERLLDSGIVPVNEWVINYMTDTATMGEHVDAISPYIRYCFSIKQPIVNTSVIINRVSYFIPEGTAYIMDGEIPHEVIHKSNEPRIMMIGAINYREIP